MSKVRSYLLVVVPILVITAVIAGGVLWEDARARKRLSAEAEPVGLVAAPVEWDDGPEDGMQDGHTLTFSWVDGQNQVHTETIEKVTWYDEANQYKVCYDPEHPDDWRFYPTTKQCGPD